MILQVCYKFRTAIDRNIQYVKEHGESVGNTFFLYPLFPTLDFVTAKPRTKSRYFMLLHCVLACTAHKLLDKPHRETETVMFTEHSIKSA